jgi:DNA-binding NarL/FixJ family response regulator
MMQSLQQKLSPREWAIAASLAEGLSYRDIAEKFNISFHTVASHVKSIVAKTGLKSSRRLAALIRLERHH